MVRLQLRMAAPQRKRRRLKVPTEKRPADAIGLAVMIGKIATGEIEDTRDASSAAAQLGSLGGRKRAANMTPERRSEIAREAAAKRWERSE